MSDANFAYYAAASRKMVLDVKRQGQAPKLHKKGRVSKESEIIPNPSEDTDAHSDEVVSLNYYG